MGLGIEVNCGHCGYKKEFFLGVGMLYSSLENVIDLVKGKNKKEILEIMRNHDISSSDFYRVLYHCNGCGALSDELYVKLVYDEGKEYTTNYLCANCGDLLEIIDDKIDITTFACPRCKNNTLLREIGIHWD